MADDLYARPGRMRVQPAKCYNLINTKRGLTEKLLICVHSKI